MLRFKLILILVNFSSFMRGLEEFQENLGNGSDIAKSFDETNLDLESIVKSDSLKSYLEFYSCKVVYSCENTKGRSVLQSMKGKIGGESENTLFEVINKNLFMGLSGPEITHLPSKIPTLQPSDYPTPFSMDFIPAYLPTNGPTAASIQMSFATLPPTLPTSYYSTNLPNYNPTISPFIASADYCQQLFPTNLPSVTTFRPTGTIPQNSPDISPTWPPTSFYICKFLNFYIHVLLLLFFLFFSFLKILHCIFSYILTCFLFNIQIPILLTLIYLASLYPCTHVHFYTHAKDLYPLIRFEQDLS